MHLPTSLYALCILALIPQARADCRDYEQPTKYVNGTLTCSDSRTPTSVAAFQGHLHHSCRMACEKPLPYDTGEKYDALVVTATGHQNRTLDMGECFGVVEKIANECWIRIPELQFIVARGGTFITDGGIKYDVFGNRQ
ncbi:hypothetical protein BU24DRAFT_417918 [Aaosphaeria arxii CBS 175.79]|uniref:Ecp2 effector protein domain-containing protein n=1 Tax=Aaosphaeria arxii CBS 175.79 TaxID=1450172 RepID=A0A6A5YCA3_9PLEO|nr:uncharacterized protein BU24DRAFT_417918 [Aaosphaeria arxii CBS 175.79]KAF2022274.1 hypothetical protein BU24DRAFT_417918 [Aaosphaeria arxii CBS 175.79]